MRYRSAHAATSGSVPFVLRGPKSVKMVLSATVAAALGLAPAFLATSPAMADTSTGGLTIANAATTEGGDITFILRCAADNTCGTDTYALTTSASGPGAATAGGVDYTAPTPTPVVYTTNGTKTVTVHTIDDQVYEGTETFTLTATGDLGDVATAVATIYDNETMPSYTLTASPTSVTESATSKTTITATLSARSALTTVISLNTANGTALSGTDFSPPALTSLVIEAGSLSASTTIAILNDGVKDSADTETFTVNGTADNASPRAQAATVSIVDAQTTPKLTLSGPSSVTEGDTAVYHVTGVPMSELPQTVKWDAVKTTLAAGEGDATPGEDFQYLTDRTVTIPAGSTSADIVIPITSDALNERTEDYAITLSSPTNAVLGTVSSVATKILDADADLAPTVSIDPQSVTEGNSGKATKTFTATLSQKSGRTVRVNWATDGDSATAGKDFAYKQGTLVFPAGTLTQTFTVDIIGDTVNEGTESFDINLSNPPLDTSATIGLTQPTVDIIDDDAVPTVTFGDLTVKEGDSGNALVLPIKLSNASSHDVTYNLTDSTQTNDGSADDGSGLVFPGSNDYQLLTNAVTIPAGQLTGYIVVLDNGDAVYETDETAYVTASVDTASHSDTYVDSSAATKTAKIMLTNDDKIPTLTIDNVTGNEGDTVNVTGSLDGSSQGTIQAAISYAGGSIKGSKAADAADFTNPGPRPLTVPVWAAPGVTFPVGQIALTDDTENEPAETIIVTGTSLGNANIANGSITIAASDGSTPPPSTGAPTIMAPEKVTGSVPVSVTGTAAAGATVELWGAPMGATKAPLVKLTTTTANATTGAYSFSRLISTGYRFQTAVGSLMSPEKMVSVVQSPLFIVSSPSAGTVSLAVQGNPRGANQSVIIQRWVNNAWVNTTWRGTTGSDNLWKATAKVPAKSSWTLRAFVAGYTPTGLLPGYSPQKTITIK